jgi:hypothetical protein
MRRRRRGDPSLEAICPIDPNAVMELWLGPSHNGSLFRDREELAQAWGLARDYMLKTFGRPGRRPLAWWAFEATVPYPGYDRETSTLYEAGALDAEERATLERRWRAEFESTFNPDFFVAVGQDEFLEGSPARRVHFAWADIPRSLVKAWTAERKRRARAIRGLASTSDSVERKSPRAGPPRASS